MNYTVQQRKNESRDRTRSAVLTVIISLLIFLGIYFYRFTKITEKPEQITTMLINFGDNQNGNQTEEPKNEEGSLATLSETVEPQPAAHSPEPRIEPKEKIITGSNSRVSVPKTDKTPAKSVKTSPAKSKTATPAVNKTASSKSATASGDGKGNAAIGNLIKGRGAKSGNQGTSGSTGNTGDPLGADGNGESKIGVDRKLVSFIPGTMGRGGAQPSHNCSASGSITVAYTVDKAGNVVSARRSGGVSDPCIVSTSVEWVKKYVKAERANTSSTGTYSIIF